MPWLSIISALLSFFLAKSKGMSTAKAAAIGAGAGLLTYAAIDPTNDDRWFFKNEGSDRITLESLKDDAPEGDRTDMGTAVVTTTGATLSTLGSSVIESTADVAKSWGPTGVVGAAVGLKSANTISDWISENKWIIPVGLIAAFIILDD